MKRMGMALVACGAAACGGPNWKGVFGGPETVTGACSDGSSGSESDDGLLDIGVNGSQIFWIECGIQVDATVNGNVATVIPASCPPETDGTGTTTVTTFTGGTLSINGDSVTENLTATVALLDGGASCNDTIVGTLGREALDGAE